MKMRYIDSTTKTQRTPVQKINFSSLNLHPFYKKKVIKHTRWIYNAHKEKLKRAMKKEDGFPKILFCLETFQFSGFVLLFFIHLCVFIESHI